MKFKMKSNTKPMGIRTNNDYVITELKADKGNIESKLSGVLMSAMEEIY